MMSVYYIIAASVRTVESPHHAETVGASLGAVIDSRHPARTRRPIYRAASEATPDAPGSSSADVQPAPPSAKQYRWLRVRNQMRPSASAGVP